VPAPPASGSTSPWRLSLDVAPVLEAGESDEVIGDVFVAAANAGLFVHTLEGRRVLFDVTSGEALARCKRIPLLPRRTYHVALVGFAEGDGLVEAAWSTSRVDARLGFLLCEISGGGVLAGERRVKLGDGLFQRKAAGSSAAALAAQAEQAAAAAAAAPGEQALGRGQHSIFVSSSAPLGEFDRPPPPPGFAPPLWEWVAADPTLASTIASAASTVSAAGDAAAAAAPPPPHGQDRWPNERGLNVLAIRLEDLTVVYDRSFDTFGVKRRAAPDCAQLAAAAAASGELGVDGPLRWRWRDHMVVVTSAGSGWEAPPDTAVQSAVAALAA
jgi:hypothetical protein